MMRMTPRLAGLVAGLLAASLGTFWDARGQAPGPDQVREEARKLEQKARELKADGRLDEAMLVRREAEELLAKAGREVRGPGRNEPGPDAQRQEMKQEMEKLRGRFEELRTAGKREEAAEVRRQLQRLERELAGPADRGPGRDEPDRPRARAMERGPISGPGQPDPEQRMRHVQAAVENLHAAGLHEMADRLAQQNERMRPNPRMDAGPRSPEGRPGELEQLRAELRQLRQELQELRRRVEETSRAPR